MSETKELPLRGECLLFHRKRIGKATVTGTYCYDPESCTYLFDFRASVRDKDPLLWRQSISDVVMETTEDEVDAAVVLKIIDTAINAIAEKIEKSSLNQPKKEDLEWADAEELVE